LIGKETRKGTLVAQSNPVELRARKLMFWYAFFMAFPAILIVQNISIFIFPFLLFTMYSLSGRFISIRYGIQFVAMAFGIGAVLSVVNLPGNLPTSSLQRSLEVLPNYLYWVLLILFLTSQKQVIRLDVIYKGIFWGVLFSLVYYFALQKFLVAIPVFKLLSQNTFAFLLICYTPIVVWYAWYRYGSIVAMSILIILVLGGFLSGSRSGSLLTLSGGLLTLLLNRKNTGSIYVIAAAGFLFIVLIFETSFVKDFVFTLNERTYQLIYNREKMMAEDRSYLVRLAQVEKSLLIHEKYPWTGIGLNNFTHYRVNLPGNFEGAKYVVNKDKIDQKSAHNSYMGFLAEGGLLLFIPFALLLAYNILWFFGSMQKLALQFKPIFMGLIHMSIHLYFIYAILNVFAWFLIALGCWVIVKYK
jgi:O-antigen ligase